MKPHPAYTTLANSYLLSGPSFEVNDIEGIYPNTWDRVLFASALCFGQDAVLWRPRDGSCSDGPFPARIRSSFAASRIRFMEPDGEHDITLETERLYRYLLLLQ